MTKIQETLVALPEEKKSSVYPGFRRCGQVLYDRLSDCPKRACDGGWKNRTVTKTACR